MEKRKTGLGLLVIVFVFGMIINGCNNNNPTTGSGNLRHLDIVGAQALMIAPQGAMGAQQVLSTYTRSVSRNSSAPALFKQIECGSWVLVRARDDNGNEMHIQFPRMIVEVSNEWVFMDFFGGNVILVSRETGYVFDISDVPPSEVLDQFFWNWDNDLTPFYVDMNGYIY